MTNILELISLITNNIHDLLIKLSNTLGYNLNDKQLHFLIIGAIGMFLFFIVNSFFRYISKYSITAISFIYTFTLMVVFVFAIEIEQKITQRGNMEFKDIIAGLWGFIEFFAIYAAVRIILAIFKKLIFKNTKKISR